MPDLYGDPTQQEYDSRSTVNAPGYSDNSLQEQEIYWRERRREAREEAELRGRVEREWFYARYPHLDDRTPEEVQQEQQALGWGGESDESAAFEPGDEEIFPADSNALPPPRQAPPARRWERPLPESLDTQTRVLIEGGRMERGKRSEKVQDILQRGRARLRQEYLEKLQELERSY